MSTSRKIKACVGVIKINAAAYSIKACMFLLLFRRTGNWKSAAGSVAVMKFHRHPTKQRSFHFLTHQACEAPAFEVQDLMSCVKVSLFHSLSAKHLFSLRNWVSRLSKVDARHSRAWRYCYANIFDALLHTEIYIPALPLDYTKMLSKVSRRIFAAATLSIPSN